MEELGTPQRGTISRKDGKPLEKGIPEYLVKPVEYEPKTVKHLHDIQLVDFGESFFISSPPSSVFTPISLHPPELVFRRNLTEAVDIWNLGSTTYELVTGRSPFEAVFDDKFLIPQFQKIIGGVPDRWVEVALKRGILKDRPEVRADSSAEGFLPLKQEIQRSYSDDCEKDTLQLTAKDLDLLEQYIRKMLIVDPKQRATADALLNEMWIAEGS
ncbi:MAG: hypothetical protein Q9160_001691 [Pyrenula sp. 1 TL-2023]